MDRRRVRVSIVAAALVAAAGCGDDGPPAADAGLTARVTLRSDGAAIDVLVSTADGAIRSTLRTSPTGVTVVDVEVGDMITWFTGGATGGDPSATTITDVQDGDELRVEPNARPVWRGDRPRIVTGTVDVGPLSYPSGAVYVASDCDQRRGPGPLATCSDGVVDLVAFALAGPVQDTLAVTTARAVPLGTTASFGPWRAPDVAQVVLAGTAPVEHPLPTIRRVAADERGTWLMNASATATAPGSLVGIAHVDDVGTAWQLEVDTWRGGTEQVRIVRDGGAIPATVTVAAADVAPPTLTLTTSTRPDGRRAIAIGGDAGLDRSGGSIALDLDDGTNHGPHWAVVIAPGTTGFALPALPTALSAWQIDPADAVTAFVILTDAPSYPWARYRTGDLGAIPPGEPLRVTIANASAGAP